MALYVKKNPVGIDWYIRKLQERLYAKLTAKWGSSVTYDCYGRCSRNKTEDGYKAEIYKGNNEYGDVYFDDATHDVVSFFGVDDDIAISEEAEANVHLVFFANINFKSSTKRSDEEIKKDVYDILKSFPEGFKVSAQKTGIERCLSEYPGTQRDSRLKFFDTHPHHVFRFDFDLRYDAGKCYKIQEEEDDETSGGGSGGTGGGTTTPANPGGSASQSEYENLSYLDIALDVAGSSILSIALSKAFFIDWGATVLKYTGSTTTFAKFSFTNATTASIRIYYQSNENYIKILCTKQKITGFAGTFPAQLVTFDLARNYSSSKSFINQPPYTWQLVNSGATTEGLTTLPYDMFPSTLKQFDISHNSFDAAALDELITYCTGLGVNSGSLVIGTQYPSADPTDFIGLKELVDSSWVVLLHEFTSGSNYALAKIESWEGNTATLPNATYPDSYQYKLSTVGDSEISVGLLNGGIVDWGDGEIRSYESATMVRKIYSGQTSVDITIHYANQSLERAYIHGKSGNTAVLTEITGTLGKPLVSGQGQVGSLNFIDITNVSLSDINIIYPLLTRDDYAVTNIAVNGFLTVSDVNSLIEFIRDDRYPDKGSGKLWINQTPAAPPTNTADIADLEFQSWQIVHD